MLGKIAIVPESHVSEAHVCIAEVLSHRARQKHDRTQRGLRKTKERHLYSHSANINWAPERHYEDRDPLSAMFPSSLGQHRWDVSELK